MKKIEIFDNFLNEDDYKKLLEIRLDEISPNSIKVYHNIINKNRLIEKSCIDENFILHLHKKYHDKVMKILEKVNKKKSELYDYSDFTIIKTGKNYKFPIHDDHPSKLLSGVIYLYPEYNTGTVFYSDKKGSNKSSVEWKQNRAIFFSRIEKETWHSYEGDGKNDRVALIYNLNTKNLREVYKIEKKKYYRAMLRWKIKPYLYDYFKINI